MVSIDEINTKMIELQDEVEGECVNNTDFYFDQIGEPLPIKPSDSDSDPIFDLQALPSQPLAVSELHRLIFVAHSDGFCVARTKDAIDSAKSSPSSSIQELSIVDVPIGKVHILALSTDNSTLAASVASHIHFFSVSSRLNQEVEPSFSCSVDETSFVKDFRWRKKSENSYVVLSKSGKLYHGAVDGPLKEVMDNVDAVEWSAKGKFVAVARKNVLSIMSLRFKERFCMSLSFKSLIGDSDCSAKVDSIRWVRPDCIILGCFRLTADGQEENYIVQVIRNKDGKITDASFEPVVLSFEYLFEGFYDDILPFGTGPHLFLSYLEQCELAITANRKNTETHIVFLGWSLGDELNEVAVIDIEREKWKPKIRLQDNGDDNLILGLCIDKVSLYEKVKILLGVDERIELSPYCILLCLTLEGKLVMFHVASTRETAVPPEVISAPSEEEDEVVDTHAAVPVQCDLSKSSLGLDKPESEHVSLGFRFQEGNEKELNMKGVGEIFKRTDPKPSDSVSLVVASPVSFNDSLLKNQKVESQLNSLSFEADRQQTVPVTKLFQDTDGQAIQPSSQQSTKLDQSSNKASFNMVSDLSKTGTQKIGSNPAFGVNSPADIPGQSDHKNLSNSVGTSKEFLGNIRSTSLQCASSQSWSSGNCLSKRQCARSLLFQFSKKKKKKRSSLFPSGSIQGNRTENSGLSYGASNVSGGLAVKPFHLKDSTGTSTLVNSSGRPVQIGGQRTSVGAGNIESSPSVHSLQTSSQEKFALGKYGHHNVHPSKENYRTQPPSAMLNSEPNSSKQFGNISELTKELDTLLEAEGAFRDACTVNQKSSVEALEEGMRTLREKCGIWKGNKKELNMKGVGEIFKRTDPKPSDSVSPVVASPVSFKDSILKNLKVESQLNSFSFEAACAGAAGEDIINEPTMPTFDLDPSKSRKTTGESSTAGFHRVNVQDFMEMFNQEGENDKSAEDFYTLSGVTVKFLRFDVPVEGLPLLEKILLKHPDFMSRCTYGNAVRKVMFQSLVAVLLDMERTPLKSLNLHKVLEWKNVLSELQSMKFDVEFILDWLKTTAASCIIRDGEIKLAELVVKIANLEKEIAAKSAEVSSLTNQRNSIMLSLSTSGGSSSAETFGEGLLD